MLKPASKLTIGRKADTESGLLGAASTVAAAASGGGAKIIDTTDEPQASTVTDLTVSLDMDGLADSFKLVMGQVGRFKVEQDAKVTIELGYADNGGLTQVMVGGVVSAEPSLTARRIVGHSAVQHLQHFCVDETFEEKSAGQIVRDLADRAGVAMATADSGISFPAYVIDGRRSVHRHMRDLAELCGFDLYVNAEDELVFQAFTGGNTVHVFDYAKHVLALEVAQIPDVVTLVEAWGESPGGQASDRWAWLTKDFSGSLGTAGSGDAKMLLERPAIRSGAAARTAADAALTDIQRRTVRAALLIAGRPEVKLGDAVRLRDLPEANMNGTYQVRAVTHRITKHGGFTTEVGLRSI